MSIGAFLLDISETFEVIVIVFLVVDDFHSNTVKKLRSETALAHRLRTAYPLFASGTQAKARPRTKSKAGTDAPVFEGINHVPR